CFDQLGHLVVCQVVKIIPAGHVNEHAIPLDEGSEASLAFSDRFSLELADRSIRGLLCPYIVDGFLSVDGGEVGAPRDRDKLVAPFNIGTEAADAYGQFLALIGAHCTLQFEESKGFLECDRL